jgi:hypothetical protein
MWSCESHRTYTLYTFLICQCIMWLSNQGVDYMAFFNLIQRLVHILRRDYQLYNVVGILNHHNIHYMFSISWPMQANFHCASWICVISFNGHYRKEEKLRLTDIDQLPRIIWQESDKRGISWLHGVSHALTNAFLFLLSPASSGTTGIPWCELLSGWVPTAYLEVLLDNSRSHILWQRHSKCLLYARHFSR